MRNKNFAYILSGKSASHLYFLFNLYLVFKIFQNNKVWGTTSHAKQSSNGGFHFEWELHTDSSIKMRSLKSKYDINWKQFLKVNVQM